MGWCRFTSLQQLVARLIARFDDVRRLCFVFFFILNSCHYPVIDELLVNDCSMFLVMDMHTNSFTHSEKNKKRI